MFNIDKNLTKVPITAYQDPAFFLSILKNENGYERLLYSSYINFIWRPDEEYKLHIDIDLGELYKHFNIESIGIIRVWDILSLNNPYEFFVNLMADKIKAGYFITGRFDEFYISSKQRYNSEHYNGQFYLTDVDIENKIFTAVGTDVDKAYIEYEITFDELIKAIEDAPESVFKDSKFTNGKFTNIISFVKSKRQNYVFSIDRVHNEMCCLLNIDNSADSLDGFAAVEYFLDNFETEYKREYVVLICEHAKLMCERLKYMEEENALPNISECVDKYKKISNKADETISYTDSDLTYIKESLREIITNEKVILLEVYAKFNGVTK